VRGIDRFLDLRNLRQHLAPFCSPMGRPLIDPKLMIRMLICSGIRSERRLCDEVHLNLAYAHVTSITCGNPKWTVDRRYAFFEGALDRVTSSAILLLMDEGELADRAKAYENRPPAYDAVAQHAALANCPGGRYAICDRLDNAGCS
jgi:hypothetical protein